MNRRIPENKLLGRMTQNNSNGNANGHHLSLFYSWYRTTAYSAVRGEESCFSRLPGVTWEDFSPVQRTWSSGGHGRMCFQHGWIVYTWCLFVNVSECFYLCGKSNNWYNLINICKSGNLQISLGAFGFADMAAMFGKSRVTNFTQSSDQCHSPVACQCFVEWNALNTFYHESEDPRE